MGIYHSLCGQCTKTAPNGSNRIRTDVCRSQIPVPYHLAILLIPYCYDIPKKNENHGYKSNQYCFILFVQCAEIKYASQQKIQYCQNHLKCSHASFSCCVLFSSCFIWQDNIFAMFCRSCRIPCPCRNNSHSRIFPQCWHSSVISFPKILIRFLPFLPVPNICTNTNQLCVHLPDHSCHCACKDI